MMEKRRWRTDGLVASARLYKERSRSRDSVELRASLQFVSLNNNGRAAERWTRCRVAAAEREINGPRCTQTRLECDLCSCTSSTVDIRDRFSWQLAIIAQYSASMCHFRSVSYRSVLLYSNREIMSLRANAIGHGIPERKRVHRTAFPSAKPLSPSPRLLLRVKIPAGDARFDRARFSARLDSSALVESRIIPSAAAYNRPSESPLG